jgi:beta-glucosidase
MTITFPDGFMWGSATAAHQIEGGNTNNDWWMWEHNPQSPCVEPSGDACDSFHRYPEDIALLAGFGFNAYRFSLEWSRIEPERGEFSRAALDHYRRMCATCHEHGIKPVVTFHHFTTPRWVAHLGGWEEPDTADHFAFFCEKATEAFGDLMGGACTINEPNIVSTIGYLAGTFPPGRRDASLRRAVNDIFIDAHHKATQAIKSGPGDAPVGLTLSMTDYQAVEGGEERRDRIRRNMEDVFLEAARDDDFIGVQTYSRARVDTQGTLGPEEGVPTVQMGYEFWPESLEATIRRAWDVTQQTPILVTENGIGTDDDDDRKRYVSTALEGVGRCLDDGIDIRGYTYWSLLDNFEWASGYRPTFGLVKVDRQTFERTPKPSAAWLGAIARSNVFDEGQ